MADAEGKTPQQPGLPGDAAELMRLGLASQGPQSVQPTSAYTHQAKAADTPTTPVESGTAGPQRGGAFVPPSAEELQRLLPQFQIIELLGRGGMGAVYKARQISLDRVVALKILPPQIVQSVGFAERFTREARALAKLNHHNVVAVYDFGHTNGLYYIVMEFVDGTNIRHMIQAGNLKPEEAMAIVPQICEALQFAHNEGIVHRDIKPENILLDKRGRVKIADFGLAKLMEPGSVDYTLTAAGGTMGTPHYMAPEQMGQAHAVDHRADIYSLGVVFYEMLTGELPLGRFAPPSKKVQIDVRVDEVVLRTLEREPEQRYQHASQVKSDVENITHASSGGVKLDRAEVGNSSRAGPALAADRTLRLINRTAEGIWLLAAVAFFAGFVLLGFNASLMGDLFHQDWRKWLVFAVIHLCYGIMLVLAGLLLRQMCARMLLLTLLLISMFCSPIAVTVILSETAWETVKRGGLGTLWIGVPLGLWTIYLLFRDDVQAAFAERKRLAKVSATGNSGGAERVPEQPYQHSVRPPSERGVGIPARNDLTASTGNDARGTVTWPVKKKYLVFVLSLAGLFGFWIVLANLLGGVVRPFVPLNTDYEAIAGLIALFVCAALAAVAWIKIFGRAKEHATVASPAASVRKIAGCGSEILIAGSALASGGFINFNFVACDWNVYHNDKFSALGLAGASTIQFLVGLAAISGGIFLRKSRFYGFVCTAAVLLCVLPCTIFFTRLGLLTFAIVPLTYGLYAGIRAISVLASPEVKTAFAAVGQQASEEAIASRWRTLSISVAITGGIAALLFLLWGLAGGKAPGRFDMLAWLPGMVAAVAATVLLIGSSASGRSAAADMLPEMTLVVLGMGVGALSWRGLDHPIPNPWDNLSGSAWESSQGLLFSLIYLALGLCLLATGGRKSRPAWRAAVVLVSGLATFALALHFASNPPLPPSGGFWHLPNGVLVSSLTFQLCFVSAFIISLLTALVGVMQLRNRAAGDVSPTATSTATEPRLSKQAVISAVWAMTGPACAAPIFLMWLWAAYPESPEQPRSMVSLLPVLIPFSALGFSAVIGATITGAVAVGRIRRSNSQLLGLPYALFGMLFYPLLLLDGLLLLLVAVSAAAIFSIFHLGMASGSGVQPQVPLGSMLLGIPLCAMIDFLIVRGVWRKIAPNLPASTTASQPIAASPGPGHPPQARRHLLCAALTLLCLVAFAFGLSFHATQGATGGRPTELITVGAVDPVFTRQSGPAGFEHRLNFVSWSFLAVVAAFVALGAVIRVAREDQGTVPRDATWWRSWWKQVGIWGGLLFAICIVRTALHPREVFKPAADHVVAPQYSKSSGAITPAGFDVHRAGNVIYLEGHHTAVVDAAVSGDGRFLATADEGGHMLVRRIDGMVGKDVPQVVDRFAGPGKPIHRLATSQDGRRFLVTGNIAPSIQITPFEYGAEEQVFTRSNGTISELFSLNSDTMIAYLNGGDVAFYDIPAHKQVRTATIFPGPFSGAICAFAVAPDRKHFAVTWCHMVNLSSTGPYVLSIYNTEGTQLLSWQFSNNKEWSGAHPVFPTSDSLAIFLPGGTMRRWTLDTAADKWHDAATTTMPSHADWLMASAASSDGKTIYLADQHTKVAVESDGTKYEVPCSPYRVLAIAADSGTLLWQQELTIGPKNSKENYSAGPINALVPVPGSNKVVAALWDGRVAIVESPGSN
jgi:hypothetical protein